MSRKNTYDKDIVRSENKDHDQILRVLHYSTNSPGSYNKSAKKFKAGYHTIQLKGRIYKGQRDIAERYKQIPYNFKGKNVLDIGCAMGGMLFHKQKDIKSGVGIDYDPKMINGCNRIRTYNNAHHLNFYTFDVAKEPLDMIHNFLDNEIDICFFLSVCMWLKPNWKNKCIAVIDFCYDLCDNLLFETNGTLSQRKIQKQYLQSKYTRVQSIHAKSKDDPVTDKRELLFCTR